jgi:Sulfotransferase family
MDSAAIAAGPLVRRPFQRMPVRFANAIGRGLGRLGKAGVLDPDAACKEAALTTGLDDFGDESFREPLKVLLESAQREARLHPVGWKGIRTQIMRRLENRLTLQACWKSSPEALEAQIRGPLFIIGLPRTGTTLLFNLLARDPAHRWMTYWEAARPVPPKEESGDQRRQRATLPLRLLNWMVPEMRSKHFFETDAPEECGLLIANSLEAELFCFEMDVPSYRAWLYERNRVASYRYYKKQLQLLQHLRPGQRWLLKLPFHAFNLDALLTVFPDACIIHTHRDLLKALPSTCSLEASYRDLYAEVVDCRQLGKDTLEQFGRGLDRCLDVRAKAPPGQFYDLHYPKFVADPVGVIKDMYRHFGFAMNHDVLARMRSYLASNPKDKHGVHRYSLAAFGLEPDAVNRRFRRYTEHFRIRPEDALRAA